LSAIFISFLMFLTCFEVLRESFVRVTNSNIDRPVVTAVSYIVMFSTMFINIAVARYEAVQGARLNSPLLLADSKHTLSDVFATCGVLISLVSIQMNFPLVDVIASVAIVGIILRAGYGIIESNLGSLVDAAVIDPSRIEALVLSVPGVTSCHKIRSRGMQDAIFIDLHVQVPHNLSIEEAHAISYNVEAKLKQSSTAITEVLVHIEDDTGATN
jgi:cation diffusion facilitator family transporter